MSDENHNMIFRALAQYAHDSFVSQKRENGETFLALKRGSADWLSRLRKAAHNGELPNDWRYTAMYAMLEQLARCEGEDARDEARDEVCDSLVDTFVPDRVAWLSDDLSRLAACDEATDEGLAGDSPGISDMITAGQYYELTATWDLIVSFLDNAAADLKDGNHAYRYTAGYSMLGYLPDDGPACFLDFEDACDHIDDIASEHAELLEEEQNEYEEGSDQFNMAAENVSAATAVGLFALEAKEPFTAYAAGRVYWVFDNGLKIDHDAI